MPEVSNNQPGFTHGDFVEAQGFYDRNYIVRGIYAGSGGPKGAANISTHTRGTFMAFASSMRHVTPNAIEAVYVSEWTAAYHEAVAKHPRPKVGDFVSHIWFVGDQAALGRGELVSFSEDDKFADIVVATTDGSNTLACAVRNLVVVPDGDLTPTESAWMHARHQSSTQDIRIGDFVEGGTHHQGLHRGIVHRMPSGGTVFVLPEYTYPVEQWLHRSTVKHVEPTRMSPLEKAYAARWRTRNLRLPATAPEPTPEPTPTYRYFVRADGYEWKEVSQDRFTKVSRWAVNDDDSTSFDNGGWMGRRIEGDIRLEAANTLHWFPGLSDFLRAADPTPTPEPFEVTVQATAMRRSSKSDLPYLNLEVRLPDGNITSTNLFLNDAHLVGLKFQAYWETMRTFGPAPENPDLIIPIDRKYLKLVVPDAH